MTLTELNYSIKSKMPYVLRPYVTHSLTMQYVMNEAS